MIKALALLLAGVTIASPAMAAEPLNTNGFINSLQNQTNQRLDQWQAANGAIAGSAVNTRVDQAQGVINTAFTQIKATNPSPNSVSPFQTFVIPPFPNLPH